MSQEPHLLYEKKDGIAYITFNRPEKRNSMDPEVMVRISDAWRDFNEDNDMRVAIITGAGDKAFCVGGDLARLFSLIRGQRKPEDEWDHAWLNNMGELLNTALLRRYELYKPVIAAINGFCIAGGTELMQATDIRIAADHATFGLAEAKIGIIPGGGSHVRLPRQIPFCKAMEIMLVGDPIPAQEAHRIGLVNYVVPKEEVMPMAEKFARKIADNGPLAVRKIKETVLRGLNGSMDEAYDIEAENLAIVSCTEDAKEGSRAFFEKRKPNYTGK